ncbi:MAG TPA: hypothetical protein VI168_00730 [Croceibacterium sp.]
MTRKFSQARKEAFLAAVRETGNQTIAAERAKVSRSWVHLHRSEDPAFRQAVDEAVLAAKAALRQAQDERGDGLKPPSGWGFLDGAELVVRGTGGTGGGKRVQIARARVRGWSPRVEDRFLTALGATCNVKAACAEVGLTPASAYGHRKRWAAFAARWDAAVEQGYEQIEMGLIECAGSFLSNEEMPDAAPLTGMTVDHAIHLLHMHKHQVRGIGKRPGLRARWPDIEEVRASILRKVEAIERHDPERLARDRKEWAQRRG